MSHLFPITCEHTPAAAERFCSDPRKQCRREKPTTHEPHAGVGGRALSLRHRGGAKVVTAIPNARRFAYDRVNEARCARRWVAETPRLT